MNETGLLCDDCLKKVFISVRDALALEQETAARFIEAQMKKQYEALMASRKGMADYLASQINAAINPQSGRKRPELSSADKAVVQAHRATAAEFRACSDWEMLRSLAELNSLSADHAARKISALILSTIGKAVPELAATIESGLGSSVGGRILDI